MAARVTEQRLERGAGRHAADLVGEELGRDVLEARGREGGGAAPALSRPDDRVGVRGETPERVVHAGEVVEGVVDRVVAARPAAGRGERHDGFGPATGGELEREVPAERVADDVGGGEARLVERPLDRIEEFANPGLVGERRTARVTGQRRRQHVVPAFERREHELPGPPRVGEPVQAQKRRAGAAAVGRREHERQRQPASTQSALRRHSSPARLAVTARPGCLGAHSS